MCIGDLGKLYDAIREREYAAANSSYAPPVSFASILVSFAYIVASFASLGGLFWRLCVTFCFWFGLFFFDEYVWQGGMPHNLIDQTLY